ncbi:MAG: PAS domain-containing sensor histidine kinase, partial [Flavisolibacter sp.]
LLEKGYYRFIHRVRTPNGAHRYIYQLARAIKDNTGNYTHAHGTAQDITEQKENELLLQASERRFKSLVQHSSDMIGIIDSVGNYSWVSENVEKFIGFTADELLKLNAIELVHPEDAGNIVERLSEIIFQKEITLEPFRFKTKTGDYRWMTSHITNLMDDPEINGLVVNSSDVTSKKFYQDQIRALSTIAEEAPHCIVLTNADQKVIWVNKIFQERTGYSIEEIFGKPFIDLYTVSGNETVLEDMQQHLRKSQPFEAVICNVNRWGRKYWVQTAVQPVYNERGEVVQYFGMSVDITERLQLEKQLKEETERRQKRVTAAVIKGQEKEREEISRELHDNVNQILATVKLYLELMRREQKEELHNQAENLLTQAINEIRKISKTLAPPALKEIELVDSIEELLSNIRITTKVRIIFKSHGLKDANLSHDVQVAVYRLIQESLTNIIRHSKATGVSISLSVMHNNITLIIKDNGIGFNTEKRRNGIGISNMINRAESLNGKLEMKSAEGQGCTLLATIPLPPSNGK